MNPTFSIHAASVRHPTMAGLRLGVSLLELLVVMVIVLAISAVTMRAMAPAFAGRKLREGARMTNVFINAARNRAIQTGRPAGVWIDRLDGLPEASVSLSYAQVADPYTGDFADSTVVGYIHPPGIEDPRTRQQYYLNVVCPVTPLGRNLDFWYTPDSKVQNLIRPGDLLKVNYQSHTYTLESSLTAHPQYRSLNPPVWIVGVGANAGSRANADRNAFSFYRGGDGGWHIDWFMGVQGLRRPFVTPGGSGVFPCTGLPYQILRSPSRQSAGSIQLPDGVVIDLNYSGDSSAPYHPRRKPGDAGNPPNSYGIPTAGSGTLGPPEATDDTTPVVIMFNPSGAVEQIYCRRWNTTSLVWEWGPNRLASQQYLLIGKSEKVPCKLDMTIEAQAENNYADPECLWVTILPTNGMVATAPSVPIVAQPSPHAGTNSARGWATQLQTIGGN